MFWYSPDLLGPFRRGIRNVLFFFSISLRSFDWCDVKNYCIILVAYLICSIFFMKLRKENGWHIYTLDIRVINQKQMSSSKCIFLTLLWARGGYKNNLHCIQSLAKLLEVVQKPWNSLTFIFWAFTIGKLSHFWNLFMNNLKKFRRHCGLKSLFSCEN